MRVEGRQRPALVALAVSASSSPASRDRIVVGVDLQSLEKVFEAFYTTKASGMVIGLSVSRSIIQRHHGCDVLLQHSVRVMRGAWESEWHSDRP
jgi:nitrogen fixation/metabolism regulation signal transduction histidine kinase